MNRHFNFAVVSILVVLSAVAASAESRNLYVCTSKEGSNQTSGGWLEKEFVIAVADDEKSVEFFSRRLLEEGGLVEFAFPGKFKKGIFGG